MVRAPAPRRPTNQAAVRRRYLMLRAALTRGTQTVPLRFDARARLLDDGQDLSAQGKGQGLLEGAGCFRASDSSQRARGTSAVRDLIPFNLAVDELLFGLCNWRVRVRLFVFLQCTISIEQSASTCASRRAFGKPVEKRVCKTGNRTRAELHNRLQLAAGALFTVEPARNDCLDVGGNGRLPDRLSASGGCHGAKECNSTSGG